MNTSVVNELRNLLYNLRLIVSSFQTDFNLLSGERLTDADCLVDRLLLKLSKLMDVVKSIKSIVKRLKKDNPLCLACISRQDQPVNFQQLN